jgi:hypothetical protein
MGEVEAERRDSPSEMPRVSFSSVLNLSSEERTPNSKPEEVTNLVTTKDRLLARIARFKNFDEPSQRQVEASWPVATIYSSPEEVEAPATHRSSNGDETQMITTSIKAPFIGTAGEGGDIL